VASFCWKTIIVLKHEPRRFVEKLDFLTSPGYLQGPGAREAAGLPKGTGPWRVVTSKALFGFDEETKKMTLIGVLKGLKPEEVIRGMGFKPIVSHEILELEPPAPAELLLLREQIDPSGLIIQGEKMQALQ
jgi:glutaconate CoA-transferase subunit B